MQGFDSISDYWKAVAAKRAELGEPSAYFFTRDYKHGAIVEVGREEAARALTEGRARLATPDEIGAHHATMAAAKATAAADHLKKLARENPAVYGHLDPSLSLDQMASVADAQIKTARAAEKALVPPLKK